MRRMDILPRHKAAGKQLNMISACKIVFIRCSLVAILSQLSCLHK